MLLELPAGGPAAAALAALAARRGVELSTLAPYYHDGVAGREALVIGYAALPEHEFEAALERARRPARRRALAGGAEGEPGIALGGHRVAGWR